MKILLNQEQLREVITEKIDELNFKPAQFFDEIYGTKLSQQYDLTPYTENELWRYWLKCRDGNCSKLTASFKYLPQIFPYVVYENLDEDNKFDIIMGVISGLNVNDIIHFSINKVPYYGNIAQKRLEEQLPKDVSKNINWVLSPQTIKIIKKHFSI